MQSCAQVDLHTHLYTRYVHTMNEIDYSFKYHEVQRSSKIYRHSGGEEIYCLVWNEVILYHVQDMPAGRSYLGTV